MRSSAEAEKLRVELSAAFETQGTELEALKVKLVETEAGALAAAGAAERLLSESARQVATLTDQAHTAIARVQEIEKRAEDLKASLSSAQGSVQRLTAALEAERGQQGVTRGRIEVLSTELVTVKAKAEAQAGVQGDQAERLKRLKKMDRPTARRLVNFMDERVAAQADPRSTGKALSGLLVGSYWRYRVGDYRMIGDIQDGALVVLVIEIGHRKDVYR